jgi:leucyl-tRNA synthetase
MAEELWEQLGKKFSGFEGAAHAQTWPTHDESLLVENEVEIVLQLNGKVRDKMIAPKDATREQLEAAARARNYRLHDLILGVVRSEPFRLRQVPATQAVRPASGAVGALR